MTIEYKRSFKSELFDSIHYKNGRYLLVSEDRIFSFDMSLILNLRRQVTSIFDDRILWVSYDDIHSNSKDRILLILGRWTLSWLDPYSPLTFGQVHTWPDQISVIGLNQLTKISIEWRHNLPSWCRGSRYNGLQSVWFWFKISLQAAWTTIRHETHLIRGEEDFCLHWNDGK